MSSTVKIYDVEKPKISLSYLLALGAIPLVGVGVWMYYKSLRPKAKNESVTKERSVVVKQGVQEKKKVSEISNKKEEIFPKVEVSCSVWCGMLVRPF